MCGGDFVTLRKYLQLARLPNVFTSPTNILAGYFILTPLSEANFINLAILMTSSAFFYVAGVIFNDYFDMELDKKERPFRPLPSDAISKERALQIAIGFMGSALILAFIVSWTSFTIAVFLSCMIFAYDYKLKHSRILNPITIGGTRFLNVILGASTAIQLPLVTGFSHLIFVAICVFVYVIVIAFFSSKELSGMRSKSQIIALFLTNYAIVIAIGIAIVFDILKPSSLLILVPFTVIISLIFRYSISGNAVRIQNTIKNLVISIIILDSIFVTGTTGLPIGLMTLLFLVPSIILSRKFYVT
ncbi:MAG: UbiA family prenyltransferase [Thaumarchaeota archaeon]|nr:UbiA family prenyltransferase [Nitrososphaerota archaeon]